MPQTEKPYAVIDPESFTYGSGNVIARYANPRAAIKRAQKILDKYKTVYFATREWPEKTKEICVKRQSIVIARAVKTQEISVPSDLNENNFSKSLNRYFEGKKPIIDYEIKMVQQPILKKES